MREALSSPEWLITEDGFDPERANVRETLFTVGNGYLGTRGTLEEGHPGRPLGHLPRGRVRRPRLPRRRPGQRAGLAVVRGVRRRHAARRAQRARCSTTSARSTCAPACSTGAPSSSTTTAAAPGWRRCAAPRVADRRICALRVEITPVNHEGEITVESAVDGGRRNLERLPVYPAGTTFPLETRWEKWALTRHLDRTERAVDGDVAYLEMRTHRERRHASATRSPTLPSRRAAEQRVHGEDERVGWRATFPGGPVRLDKLVRIGTSRDVDGGEDVQQGCLDGARGAPGRRGSTRSSRRAPPRGRSAGTDCDVTIDGDPREHPGHALRHLPPADRRERRRPHRQHRREVALRRGLPGPRVLGHRDPHAALLRLHPPRRGPQPAAPTATTRCPARGRTPGSTARPGRATRGSRPTPASRSAPSSPRTGPTGSGRARRRCTSTPTSRAG